MTDEPDAPDDLHRAHLYEMDRIRVDRFYQSAHARLSIISELALLALKTFSVLSGGAIIALFTLLGHLKELHADLTLVWWSFAMFIVDLVLIQVAMIIGYVAQNTIMHAEFWQAETLFWSVFEREVPPGHEAMAKRGSFLLKFAIGSSIAGILAFAAGAIFALRAVTVT